MKKRTVILAIFDVLLAVTAYFYATLMRFGLDTAAWYPASIMVVHAATLAAALVLASYFTELYNVNIRLGRTGLILRVSLSVALTFLLLSSTYYVLPEYLLSRGVLFHTLLMFALCQYVWHRYADRLMRMSGLRSRCLILGVGDRAVKMAETIAEHSDCCKLVGFVNPNGYNLEIPADQVVGPVANLPEIAAAQRVACIIVALSERRGVLPVKELLHCRFAGVEVLDAISFYERVTGRLLVTDINPAWFIYSGGFSINSFVRFHKRLLDVVLATAGLLFTAPVLPLIALAIRLDSNGDVFFTQTRVGENGKPFKLYKFRSMRQDAEVASGAVWSPEDDPRITTVGRFLRKSRLDELPQLFNVLRGEMSLVGPRPERPEFVSSLEEEIPYYSKRHVLKPGITGWAQVMYPYGASVEDSLVKLKYDLYYIKNFSLFFDIRIIVDTIKVVLFGRGGR